MSFTWNTEPSSQVMEPQTESWKPEYPEGNVVWELAETLAHLLLQARRQVMSKLEDTLNYLQVPGPCVFLLSQALWGNEAD